MITKVDNPSDFFGNIFERATIEAPVLTASQAYVLQHLVSNGNTSISFGVAQPTPFAPTWTVSNVTINGTATFNLSDFNFGTINETTPSVMIANGSSSSTVNFNGTNSTTGGLQLSQGRYNANVADSLGKGPVTVFSAYLYLNATNAAQSTIASTGTVHYAANGGGGGNRITSSTLYIDSGVTSLGNGVTTDILSSTNIIYGNATRLALLDRGIESGTVPNFDPAPGSMIDNSDPGLPTARNLGTNADLIASMHTITPLTLAVGAGTPWEGVAANSGGFFGTLLGNSGFTLAGGTFGIGGAAGSFNIPTVGGTSKVPVTVSNTEFVSSLSDYSGVSTFFATGSFNLFTSNALGGGNGTLPVPVDVTGDLIVSNATALNGNVVLHGGSTIELKISGLNGTGTITRDSQPITIYIDNANALSGTQLNAVFIHAGDTIHLAVRDVVGIQSMDPGANYVLDFSNEQAGGFNLNGGSLTLPFSGSLQQPLFASGNGTIAIGALGATIVGVGTGNIGVAILAQGTVDFGSPTGSGGYSIELSNASVNGLQSVPNINQFNAVNVNNITLISDSPAELTGANITLNGGGLVLEQRTYFPTPPTTVDYPNVITVSGSASISSYAYRYQVSLHLPLVNLSSSNLSIGAGLLLDRLNLTGNGTLIANLTMPITIGSVTQNDATPRSLTLSQPSDGQTYSSIAYRISGNVDSTGPITLTGSVEAEFDGIVASSSAPLTISATGVLTGTGTIHRPVVFSKYTFISTEQILQPGIPIDIHSSITHSTAGTLTIDSLVLNQNTFLSWNLGQSGVIGGPTNDLVAVLGNLTLDGAVSIATNFPIGTYTLFTYGGTLTDNGLRVPTIAGKSIVVDLSVPGEVNLVITATPEPVSLGVMLPVVLMLGRRRRR